jgi:glycosyltransferase involved in cell wall biosynthesis
VRFLGQVQNIPGLLRTWHLVVHSTSPIEGFGLAMIEAMAANRPLIATDVGSAREVTDGGRVALLVPPDAPEALAKAILYTGQDTVDTRRRTEAALAWVSEKFSAKVFVARYLDALQLANAHRSGTD